MRRLKVIAIVGPTASGKSAMGEFLAKKLDGEIISADSRQLYKGMKVITRASKGHMVGVADPRRPFSAGEYVITAEQVLKALVKKKKVPIVVGGTGFYADALLRGFTLPAVEPNNKLRTQLNKKTAPQLLAMLKKVDKKSAKRVDPNNKVRLIRALEIAKALGSVPTLKTNARYETLWLGLSPSLTMHARAIEKGVHERLRAGMIREVKKLRAHLSNKRFLSLGFEFVLLARYLDKKITRPELVRALTNDERKYALRQMRWFKRNSDIHWITHKSEALRRSRVFLQ